jgi:hypothetical protein
MTSADLATARAVTLRLLRGSFARRLQRISSSK